MEVVKVQNWAVEPQGGDEINVNEVLKSHSSQLANEYLLEMENEMNDKSQEPFLLSP
jgi:hypothetical protein